MKEKKPPMDKLRFFRIIFSRALNSISEDLQNAQDKIIRRERFGDNASNFPSGSHPLRKHKTLQKDIEQYEELLKLFNEVQALADMLDEEDAKRFAKWFKESYKPS